MTPFFLQTVVRFLRLIGLHEPQYVVFTKLPAAFAAGRHCENDRALSDPRQEQGRDSGVERYNPKLLIRKSASRIQTLVSSSLNQIEPLILRLEGRAG